MLANMQTPVRYNCFYQKQAYSKILNQCLGLFAMVMPFTIIGSTASASDSEYVFNVLLDKKPIGQHVFEITDHETDRTVVISADFEVTIFKIPFYTYVHRNTETWRNGCLASMDSITNDNGNEFTVLANNEAQHLSIETKENSAQYEDACPMSFAYWDKSFLQQKKLINSQNGAYMNVSIDPIDTLPDFDALQNIEIEGYRIRSADESLDIKVWYDMNTDRWVALQSYLENGRTLKYLSENRGNT